MRRIIDVKNLEPRCMDEAMDLRNRLIDEVQRIQAQLTERRDQDDDDPAWRGRAIRTLNAKQRELRRVKDWLRRHNLLRQTEWELLGRATAVLRAMLEAGLVADAAEAEELLADIEKQVPQWFLERSME